MQTCVHAAAWTVAAGVVTCPHCGVRRFTAYAALWREVPGPPESGPTATVMGTGLIPIRPGLPNCPIATGASTPSR
ncbi:DUF6255 family natural product biosynthesis protein [Streptomyces sp. AV19]|uniref:DUF6255 family natural product biosynthesis protein n=1 Tax=Streptomyces sp. AV19 TaxID=2793068 RepID=UPI0035AC226F